MFTLLTLPDHPNSPSIFSGVGVAQSIVYCQVFGTSLLAHFFFFFWSFHFLSDLRFLITPFGIFKLFISLSTRRFCGEVEVDFMVIYVVNTVYISNWNIMTKNSPKSLIVYNVRLRNVFWEITSIISSFCTHNRYSNTILEF